MNRSRLRRGPWRRKKNRPPRPGGTETPRSNAAWKRLCATIWARDHGVCRRCGFAIEPRHAAGHIDHIVPRRLCPSAIQADHADNLALLCTFDHAHKTQVVEPALYRGDVLTFTQFYRSLGPPFPPEDLRTAAYRSLTASMQA